VQRGEERRLNCLANTGSLTIHIPPLSTTYNLNDPLYEAAPFTASYFDAAANPCPAATFAFSVTWTDNMTVLPTTPSPFALSPSNQFGVYSTTQVGTFNFEVLAVNWESGFSDSSLFSFTINGVADPCSLDSGTIVISIPAFDTYTLNEPTYLSPPFSADYFEVGGSLCTA